MPRQRSTHQQEIEDWLRQLEIWVCQNGIIAHQNVLIDLENFFRDLLNLLHGWRLGNANALFGKNHEGFDLSDTEAGIAVQVTATLTAKKISKTLTGFIGKHETGYKRLIMMYPTHEIGESRKDFTSELAGFDFAPQRDRWGLGHVLEQAHDMTVDRQGELVAFLRKELKGLDSTGLVPLDATVDVLIRVIHYLSNAKVDPDTVSEEVSPDQKRKLERFREHAAFLKRQYTDNLDCHVRVAAARDAVGVDTIRALRMQSWLKTESLHALAIAGGDARSAFDQLVEKLLATAKSNGSYAEKTAVAYYLADELTRCNVFPNEGHEESRSTAPMAKA